MAKSTDFLGVEPIKVAFLASISPSVDTAIISEGHIVVLSHGDVHYLASFGQGFHQSWLGESNVVFVAMAQHSPISISKCVQEAIFVDDCGVSLPNRKLPHIQVIKLCDSLRISLRHGHLSAY